LPTKNYQKYSVKEYKPDSDPTTSTTERVLYFPVSTLVYCSITSTQFISKSRLTVKHIHYSK
jgi:hypothetical protein